MAMLKQIKVQDIADRCMVSRVTVLRWIKQGKLQAMRLPSGHYRVKEEDFDSFMEKYDIH